MTSPFYCPACGDTRNTAYAGAMVLCACLDGVSMYEWCLRVVEHRRRQGKAMSRWVVDEWLTGWLWAAMITDEEYQAIRDRQMRLGI